MRYGVSMPNFADYGDVHTLVELAREAETAGWDGFFLWDHMIFWRDLRMPIVDPWVALAAIAAGTERIRLGPMVTPVARRRPWKLARETVTLDHLSGGRLTLGVGLGDLNDPGYAGVGEVTDARKTRDRLLQQLQALGHEFPIDRSEPSEVPAGSRQTLDQSDRNRFTHLGEDDGKSGARPLHGKGCWRVDGKYELEWQARQFGR